MKTFGNNLNIYPMMNGTSLNHLKEIIGKIVTQVIQKNQTILKSFLYLSPEKKRKKDTHFSLEEPMKIYQLDTHMALKN